MQGLSDAAVHRSTQEFFATLVRWAGSDGAFEIAIKLAERDSVESKDFRALVKGKTIPQTFLLNTALQASISAEAGKVKSSLDKKIAESRRKS